MYGGSAGSGIRIVYRGCDPSPVQHKLQFEAGVGPKYRKTIIFKFIPMLERLYLAVSPSVREYGKRPERL